MKRCRAYELNLQIGQLERGEFNAITDVKGVKVGHHTLMKGSADSHKQHEIARTGVTAIIPNDDVFMKSVAGGGFVLNGAGEVSGLNQVLEWGVLETPILLTNTLSVGICSSALINQLLKLHPGIGSEHDVIIPLVGECDDSFMNGIAGRHINESHALLALEAAKDGPVEEGNVGGGTGMITCDLKGGIGTSSRKIKEADGGFTVGVLVMSNFGRLVDFSMDGIPVGRILEKEMFFEKRKHNYGSIITVVATDAPLSGAQLNRLAKRAALGIGRVGSYAAHGSGEIVLSFSTSNVYNRQNRSMYYDVRLLRDKFINPLYEAVIDATQEAILNAVCMGEDMIGANGMLAPALPLERVREIMGRYG